MSIRGGNYQKEEGSFYPEFFELVNGLVKRMEYAVHNTSLPPRPNYRRIAELVMSVNERVVRGDNEHT